LPPLNEGTNALLNRNDRRFVPSVGREPGEVQWNPMKRIRCAEELAHASGIEPRLSIGPHQDDDHSTEPPESVAQVF
jgi:hypothetical protein